MDRVAERGGGLRAAMAKGVGRGVRAELVWDAGAIMGGVQNDAQAPVDRLAKRVIEHAGALARGHQAHGFRRENARAFKRAAEPEHFVKSREVVHWAAGAGRGAR